MDKITEKEIEPFKQRSYDNTTIDLGYMSIVERKWEDGYEGDEGDTSCDLYPFDIVIPYQQCTIDYTYPLSRPLLLQHTTNNIEGFTRQKISEQIMLQYKKIYEEEEEDCGDPGRIEGMINRAQSHGRFGIWGHYLGDLMLHSLYLKDDGHYGIGIDS